VAVKRVDFDFKRALEDVDFRVEVSLECVCSLLDASLDKRTVKMRMIHYTACQIYEFFFCLEQRVMTNCLCMHVFVYACVVKIA
jgi:hypothetical protein